LAAYSGGGCPAARASAPVDANATVRASAVADLIAFIDEIVRAGCASVVASRSTLSPTPPAVLRAR